MEKVIGGSKPKGEVFVAFYVGKGCDAVSIAEGSRDGEVRYFDQIDNAFEAPHKLILIFLSLRNQCRVPGHISSFENKLCTWPSTGKIDFGKGIGSTRDKARIAAISDCLRPRPPSSVTHSTFRVR